MSHPYLSPPTEHMIYATTTTFIDPKQLTATAPSEASQEDTMTVMKEEHDDDYGFAKFAAERDALRNEHDEDSKLLMSEAGKNLSSKERRQLRNKVSARNFRERRKEYIVHLEGLVSKHQNEATMYKQQVDTLKSEKDDLASELSKLKISISAAIESNKLTQVNTGSSAQSTSRCSTPTRERDSLIPNMQKDVNPWSANANFNTDWPLSGMGSPSTCSFEFNLHNYTSVFSAYQSTPATFSEKELMGKSEEAAFDSSSLVTFDKVLSSLLGDNWRSIE